MSKSDIKMRKATNKSKICLLIILIALSAKINCQPLPSMHNWDYRKIKVAENCYATSMLPQDRNNITVEWRGSCVNGLANGVGVILLKINQRALEILSVEYKNGKNIRVDEKFFYSLGKLFGKNNKQNTVEKRITSEQSLPEWAKEIWIEESYWELWRKEDIINRQRETREMIYNHGTELDNENSNENEIDYNDDDFREASEDDDPETNKEKTEPIEKNKLTEEEYPAKTQIF